MPSESERAPPGDINLEAPSDEGPQYRWRRVPGGEFRIGRLDFETWTDGEQQVRHPLMSNPLSRRCICDICRERRRR